MIGIHQAITRPIPSSRSVSFAGTTTPLQDLSNTPAQKVLRTHWTLSNGQKISGLDILKLIYDRERALKALLKAGERSILRNIPIVRPMIYEDYPAIPDRKKIALILQKLVDTGLLITDKIEDHVDATLILEPYGRYDYFYGCDSPAQDCFMLSQTGRQVVSDSLY